VRVHMPGCAKGMSGQGVWVCVVACGVRVQDRAHGQLVFSLFTHAGPVCTLGGIDRCIALGDSSGGDRVRLSG
jgi:hypothetical protein